MCLWIIWIRRDIYIYISININKLIEQRSAATRLYTHTHRLGIWLANRWQKNECFCFQSDATKWISPNEISRCKNASCTENDTVVGSCATRSLRPGRSRRMQSVSTRRIRNIFSSPQKKRKQKIEYTIRIKVLNCIQFIYQQTHPILACNFIFFVWLKLRILEFRCTYLVVMGNVRKYVWKNANNFALI